MTYYQLDLIKYTLFFILIVSVVAMCVLRIILRNIESSEKEKINRRLNTLETNYTELVETNTGTEPEPAIPPNEIIKELEKHRD